MKHHHPLKSMNHKLTSLMAALAAAILIASPIPASAQDAPAFLEVGKWYTLSYPTENRFKVLEIGKDGWVKIAMQQGNQVMWLNTKAAVLIAPYPAQTAE